jgi:hypothetical protein
MTSFVYVVLNLTDYRNPVVEKEAFFSMVDAKSYISTKNMNTVEGAQDANEVINNGEYAIQKISLPTEAKRAKLKIAKTKASNMLAAQKLLAARVKIIRSKAAAEIKTLRQDASYKYRTSSIPKTVQKTLDAKIKSIQIKSENEVKKMHGLPVPKTTKGKAKRKSKAKK